MNGPKPPPARVKRRTQRWGRCINKMADGRVYAKVDGAFHLIGNMLFNDEREHMFKTQAHMCTKEVGDAVPSDDEGWTVNPNASMPAF